MVKKMKQVDEPRSWRLLKEIVKEKPAKAGNHRGCW
jgi:hypothetical protein